MERLLRCSTCSVRAPAGKPFSCSLTSSCETLACPDAVDLIAIPRERRRRCPRLVRVVTGTISLMTFSRPVLAEIPEPREALQTVAGQVPRPPFVSARASRARSTHPYPDVIPRPFINRSHPRLHHPPLSPAVITRSSSPEVHPPKFTLLTLTHRLESTTFRRPRWRTEGLIFGPTATPFGADSRVGRHASHGEGGRSGEVTSRFRLGSKNTFSASQHRLVHPRGPVLFSGRNGSISAFPS